MIGGAGKVILLGEHAVVYGEPALAVGIERGAIATVEVAPALSRSQLTVAGWETVARAGDDDLLSRAFSDLLAASGGASVVSVRVETDLWPGAGLGCSAAMGVAVSRALEPSIATGPLLERVMAWERVFHGNPSGVDAAVATLGAPVSFRKGDPPHPLRLPVPLHLAIGHSGVASSTKSMVDAVRRQFDARPASVGKAFAGIGALVQNGAALLMEGDLVGLGRLLDMNQLILSGLLVSTLEIEEMCQIARTAGALGAKLTGAGGGGCVVALCDSREGADAVVETWQRNKYSAFSTRVAPTIERSAPRPLEAGP